MIRLVFSDLRHHVTTWIGAFIVAVGCGYIGGWVVSLQVTAGFYTGDIQKSLQNAGSMMFVFSLIAGVAVLISAASLTVSTQQRSYALWQLVNVRPWLVSLVVLVQLAVVAALGALCGTLLAAATFDPLFPWVFSEQEYVSQVVPHAGVSLLPTVWLVVIGVFLLGGLKGARSAGITPPLTVLREPEPKRTKVGWLRVLLFVVLAACTCWIALLMADSPPNEAMAWSIFVPILVAATLIPVAPLIFAVLLSAWTILVPQKHWNAWYLARHTAQYGLSTSTSVETPVMVGFALVAGIFSVIQVLAAYAQSQGATDTSGYLLDSTTTLVMLGGPVLLCAIGAAVSVLMSSRSRAHEVALLTAGGARPATLMIAAGCEALIHTATATLVGIISVIISTAIVAHAFGLPLFDGVTFAAGLVVSLVGFALVLIATLVPTHRALNREAATILAINE
jgi:putative ABC transport system permease protein